MRLDLVVLSCTFIYQQLCVCYNGDSVKSVQMRWLVQPVHWRPCIKSLLQIKYLFMGIQQSHWPAGCIYAQSRQSLRSTLQILKTRVWNCSDVGVPVQTVKDLQRLPDVCSPLKMSPTNNEPFCEIFVLFSCVYQYWLKPTCASVQICKSIFCLHTVYLSHVHIHVPILTCRRNYPVGLSSKVLKFGV